MCEVPRKSRAVACVVAIVGVVLILYHDLLLASSSANVRQGGDGGMIVIGDMFALASAVLGGLYSVLVNRTFVAWTSVRHFERPRINHAHTESTNSESNNSSSISDGNEMKFVGFGGLFMTLLMLASFLVLHLSTSTGTNTVQMKTTMQLLMNAIIGEVLPACIWTKASKHAPPVMTAMSTVLMVPLSVAADVARGRAEFRPLFVVGTCVVIASFFALAFDGGGANAEGYEGDVDDDDEEQQQDKGNGVDEAGDDDDVRGKGKRTESVRWDGVQEGGKGETKRISV